MFLLAYTLELLWVCMLRKNMHFFFILLWVCTYIYIYTCFFYNYFKKNVSTKCHYGLYLKIVCFFIYQLGVCHRVLLCVYSVGSRMPLFLYAPKQF